VALRDQPGDGHATLGLRPQRDRVAAERQAGAEEALDAVRDRRGTGGV